MERQSPSNASELGSNERPPAIQGQKPYLKLTTEHDDPSTEALVEEFNVTSKKRRKPIENMDSCDSSSSGGFLGDMEDFFMDTTKYFRTLNLQQEMDHLINESRLPRDPKTERRCQYFSIVISIISLIAIFGVAITYPYVNPAPISTHEEAIAYRTLCSVSEIIPKFGTADCTSSRSRINTIVTCTITCDWGVSGKYRDHVPKTKSENQFRISCNNVDGWDIVRGINDLCINDMTKK